MENLSKHEMKKIIKQIVEEECKDLECNIFPITVVDYCNMVWFNKNIKFIDKLKFSTKALSKTNAFEYKKNIVIFLDKIQKEKPEEQLLLLTSAVYHEIRHCMQYNQERGSYAWFAFNLDSMLYSDSDYSLHHDKYSYEIDANLYGNSKAKEYLKKNYPDVYEKKKRKIERREKKYGYDFAKYDITDLVEQAICGIKSKKIQEKNIIDTFDIFLEKDGNFKNFRQIINSEEFKNLDPRIIHAFLSTKSFREQIDPSKLSVEDLTVLKNSLEYTYNFYMQRLRAIREENKDRQNDLNMLKFKNENKYKMKMIKNQYTKIKLFLLSARSRRERERLNNKKDLRRYLYKTEQLIEERKNTL